MNKATYSKGAYQYPLNRNGVFGVLFFCGLFIAAMSSAQQQPSIRWQRVLGGVNTDSLVNILPTADSGFIISGYSNSGISSSKSADALNGSFDYWIVKLNSEGGILWEYTLGGFGNDIDPYVLQTRDGGFLVGGRSMSQASGDKTENALNLSADYWLVKLDDNGMVQWNNTIGGIQMDAVAAMAPAPEQNGGFLVAGYSHSGLGGDKKEDNRGSNLWADYWVMKISNTGKLLWQKAFGGKNDDMLTCMEVTRDSGYLFGGYSYSPSGFEKTDSFIGNNDFWIVKTDVSGIRQWDKVIGGAFSDFQTALVQTADSGFLAGGYSNSPAGFNKSAPSKGVTDYWVVKIDESGNVLWDKTYGGSKGDFLTCLSRTADGGFILGGHSASDISGEKTEASRGGFDIWLIKTDSAVNILWDKTIGGAGRDKLSSIQEIAPGEFILGGSSDSPESGEKDAGVIGNSGKTDFWILRLSNQGPVVQERSISNDVKVERPAKALRKLELRIAPNPVKNRVVLHITGANPADPLQLVVYTGNGRMLQQYKLPAGTTQYPFQLSGKPPGMYYAMISAGNSAATCIIIKE